MPQFSAPQILTANDLLSGEVVYHTKTGAWSCRHKDAAIFDQPNPAADCLKEIIQNDASVVSPYLVRALPMHFREAFRAAGPSNRFIGKQAGHT